MRVVWKIVGVAAVGFCVLNAGIFIGAMADWWEPLVFGNALLATMCLLAAYACWDIWRD